MIRTALLVLLCAPLATIAAPAGPDAAQPNDRDFVLAATQAGQQEVHDAGWAAMSSHMEPIRQIAQMLLEDHNAWNAKLSTLAHDKGMTLPVTAASANPTPSFSDGEYVASQIQSHEDAIALFSSEADRGADQDFRAFAQQMLPVLRSHLKALRALQDP